MLPAMDFMRGAIVLVVATSGCKGDDGDDGAAGETEATGAATSSPADDGDGVDDGADAPNDDGDDGQVDSTAADDGGDDEGGPPAGPGLDDEFDADLSAWDLLNASEATATVADGALVLEPTANSLWYQGDSAVHVHKLVAGDFAMTGFVRARSIANPEAPPTVPYRLGGLMARSPVDAGGLDYVFIVIGADEDDVAVETKTTIDSSSTFMGPPWPSAEGELRVCRVGSTFELLIRAQAGDAWESRATFERPDLPGALAVGPLAYAFQPDPDLRVTFDYVRFVPVTDLADCRE